MNSDWSRTMRSVVAGRHAPLDVLEPLLDVADDLDGVGARLLADLQQHRRLAVDAGQRRRLGYAVLDARDVARPAPGGRRPARMHDLAELLGRVRRARACASSIDCGALLDAAAGDVDVLRLQRRATRR